MKNLFSPTWFINSIYSIQPEDLKRHGFEAAICDLDNTLIAWNEYEHTEEMSTWVRQMQSAGIQIYLLSNNNSDRVAKVASPLEVPFTASALKPLRRNFSIAIDNLKIDNDKIVVIGDQMMTDIIGANRRGLKSILVKPIAKNDNIYTWINRSIERMIMKKNGIDRFSDWGDTLD